MYIDGNVSIDGVDKSSVHLDALIIRETYTGQFGTSAANPVKIAVDGECSVLGGSAVYLNSGVSNPIVNLLVNMPAPQRIFDIGGTVTYGEYLRGSLVSAASYTECLFDALDGNSLNLPQPKFNGGTITAGDAINTDVWVMAATTFTAFNFIDSRCWNYAGTFTAASVIGRLAEFKHYHTATIGTLRIKNGAFFNGAVDRRTKTITNVIKDDRSRIDAGNITLTNGVKKPSRLAATDYAGAR